MTNGTFTLDRDPSHPTGKVLCVKGKEAPAITAHADRLRYPMMRTNPKGSADPGWRRISLGGGARTRSPTGSGRWPATTARSRSCSARCRRRRRRSSTASTGSSGCSGRSAARTSSTSMELCGWGRYLASLYTYGAPVPGQYMPDLDRAECILFWGYNPSVSRLAHATATRAALRRGAKLIVVDPRRAGLATKADPWLRVRPGTDAALALAITNVMIERGWYDEAFVRRWTNGPLLVRGDTGPVAPRQRPARRRGRRALRRLGRGRRASRSSVDPAAGGGDVDDHDRLALGRDGRGADGRTARSPAGPRSISSPSSAEPLQPTVAEEITGVPAGRHRAHRAGAVGAPPGRVLHVERSRAAQRHDPDHPRDQRAVRADRLPRRARGQRAVHARADEPDRRGGAARPGAARRRRSASASGRSARPASGSSPARTSTPPRSKAVRTGRAGSSASGRTC